MKWLEQLVIFSRVGEQWCTDPVLAQQQRQQLPQQRPAGAVDAALRRRRAHARLAVLHHALLVGHT